MPSTYGLLHSSRSAVSAGCLEVRRIRTFVPSLNKEQRTQPQRSRRCLETRRRGAFALGLVINGVFDGGILLYSLDVGAPRAVVFMMLLNSSSSTTFPLINSFSSVVSKCIKTNYQPLTLVLALDKLVPSFCRIARPLPPLPPSHQASHKTTRTAPP